MGVRNVLIALGGEERGRNLAGLGLVIGFGHSGLHKTRSQVYCLDAHVREG